MTELNFEIQHKDVFPNREIHETKQLSDRPTAKILLKDTDGMICLTAKTNSNFYFLPGGGIEAGESETDAIKRECLEEAGCNISIDKKICDVTEYREEVGEKRIVSCFSGNVIGEKSSPTLAVDDIGFDVVWHTLDKAIELLTKQLKSITEETDNFYTRKFNTARDLRILQLDVCGFI